MTTTVAAMKKWFIRLTSAIGAGLFLTLMAGFVSANLLGYVPAGTEGIFCQSLSLDEDFSPGLLRDRAFTTAHFDGGTGYPRPASLRDHPGTVTTYQRHSAARYAVTLFFEIPDGAQKGMIMRRNFEFDGCGLVTDRDWAAFARESHAAAIYRSLLSAKATGSGS